MSIEIHGKFLLGRLLLSTNPSWAPGSDKARGKETDHTFDPLLLRQGEPGTSHYISVYGQVIYPTEKALDYGFQDCYMSKAIKCCIMASI